MIKTAQNGFSLVSAIFLLVVIAALGAFAVTLSTAQNRSQTMEISGARAYQAALAGVEWAAYNVKQSVPGVQWAGCVAGAPVVAGGNLAAYTIIVDCTPSSYMEGAATVWIYDVTAKATAGGAMGDVNYVEQVATARLGR